MPVSARISRLTALEIKREKNLSVAAPTILALARLEHDEAPRCDMGYVGRTDGLGVTLPNDCNDYNVPLAERPLGHRNMAIVATLRLRFNRTVRSVADRNGRGSGQV